MSAEWPAEVGEKCWRHDYGAREYICRCTPPVVGDTGTKADEIQTAVVRYDDKPSSCAMCPVGLDLDEGCDCADRMCVRCHRVYHVEHIERRVVQA